MLKFTGNTHGIMGLTLSQIGLIIVTGIIIVALFSFIYLNDWKRTAELNNISSSFITIVKGVESRFFENITNYYFPKKSYYYNVSVSTEYLTVSAKGNLYNELIIKDRFLIKPWPRLSNQTWKTGEELHNYCMDCFDHFGTNIDPITQENLYDLNSYKNNSKINLASKPLYLNTNKPVYIEKVVIFFDDIKKQDYILIYQIE